MCAVLELSDDWHVEIATASPDCVSTAPMVLDGRVEVEVITIKDS